MLTSPREAKTFDDAKDASAICRTYPTLFDARSVRQSAGTQLQQGKPQSENGFLF